MNLLAIETSSAKGSIAWSFGGNQQSSYTFSSAGRHSEWLALALQELHLQNVALDEILIGLGPGSFTSIRVAIAMAQGIAAVKGCRVRGLWSHYSQGMQRAEVTRLILLSDARRGHLYVTEYERGKLYRPTYLIPRENLDDVISKGTLAASSDFIDQKLESCIPRAEDYLSIRIKDAFCDWKEEPLEAFYLPVEVKQ
jgi:tRNA threonylcarbamoyladenosine biosynthesis protein TsaB